ESQYRRTGKLAIPHPIKPKNSEPPLRSRLHGLPVTHPGKTFRYILGVRERRVARRVTTRNMEVGERCVLIHVDTSGQVERHRSRSQRHLISDNFPNGWISRVGTARNCAVANRHLLGKSNRFVDVFCLDKKGNWSEKLFTEDVLLSRIHLDDNGRRYPRIIEHRVRYSPRLQPNLSLQFFSFGDAIAGLRVLDRAQYKGSGLWIINQ